MELQRPSEPLRYLYLVTSILIVACTIWNRALYETDDLANTEAIILGGTAYQIFEAFFVEKGLSTDKNWRVLNVAEVLMIVLLPQRHGWLRIAYYFRKDVKNRYQTA